MIEADFEIPNIRKEKIVDLFWLGFHIHSLFLQCVTAKEIEQITGLSERTLLRLANHSAMVIKRGGGVPNYPIKGGA